jgi:hypothetical protein
VPLDIGRRRRLAAQHLRDTAAAARARWSVTLVITALGVVLGGLVGAGAGQWVGWRAAGPLPSDSDASAVARLALGGVAPLPQRYEPLFGYDADGGYGPGRVRFTVPADPAAPAFERQAQDVRIPLDTAGWKVDKAGRTGLVFVADKGDWRVRFSTATEHVHLDLVRAQPLWVLLAAALGGVLGAALGGLLARRAWRRGVRLRQPWRRVGATAAASGGGLLLPAFGSTLVQQITGYAQLSRPQVPLWAGAAGPVTRPTALLATALLTVALAVVAVGRAAPVADPPDA